MSIFQSDPLVASEVGNRPSMLVVLRADAEKPTLLSVEELGTDLFSNLGSKNERMWKKSGIKSLGRPKLR